MTVISSIDYAILTVTLLCNIVATYISKMLHRKNILLLKNTCFSFILLAF